MLMTGAEGILACPDPVVANTTATFEIYAKTPGFVRTDCTALDGLLPTYVNSEDYGAWEYA